MHWIAKPARRILDLNRSLETAPRQANLFKERAAEYERLWNYEQVIADYSSFLALQPEDAGALHLRGVAYERMGQLDRALEDYRQAIAVDPGLSDLYINRGVTYGRTGNLRQSVLSLNEGIRLAPQNPDGYFNRGTSYFQLGDLERAIADFSMVIQLSPNDEAAYYWRGISNEEAGHPGEAIADYRQFLALSQDENARQEVEQRLSQWQAGNQSNPGTVRDLLGKVGRRLNSRSAFPEQGQKTNELPAPSGEPDQPLDLYGLIAAFGERALQSIWFGSGVECYGETAEELHALTGQDRPIEGGEFLTITSGVRQTTKGDFLAFDRGAAAHWLLIRAWGGNGFYIEIDDPNGSERLKTQFPWVEEVDGASPPYASLFLRI
jgi:tetratricopeptide (TPR) repeat protein